MSTAPSQDEYGAYREALAVWQAAANCTARDAAMREVWVAAERVARTRRTLADVK